MSRQRSIGADQLAILRRAIATLQQSQDTLKLVASRVYTDDINDKLVGHATREAITQLNCVRAEWGFDEMLPPSGELTDET